MSVPKKMSASSRSTIFSLKGKKSRDSPESQTQAGPAYDALPMSPRPPISVSHIIPPSQQNGRMDSPHAKLYIAGDSFEGEESSDAQSVKSEPRNAYGSLRGGGVNAAGGVSGPRPLPPRSGSVDKMPDNSKYNLMGHDSPHV